MLRNGSMKKRVSHIKVLELVILVIFSAVMKKILKSSNNSPLNYATRHYSFGLSMYLSEFLIPLPISLSPIWEATLKTYS